MGNTDLKKVLETAYECIELQQQIVAKSSLSVVALLRVVEEMCIDDQQGFAAQYDKYLKIADLGELGGQLAAVTQLIHRMRGLIQDLG